VVYLAVLLAPRGSIMNLPNSSGEGRLLGGSLVSCIGCSQAVIYLDAAEEVRDPALRNGNIVGTSIIHRWNGRPQEFMVAGFHVCPGLPVNPD
jgi:hypothetical protein